jgi:hypothetical protein
MFLILNEPKSLESSFEEKWNANETVDSAASKTISKDFQVLSRFNFKHKVSGFFHTLKI